MRVPWPHFLRNSSSTNKEASPCPGFLVVLLPDPTIWGHQGKRGVNRALPKGPPTAHQLTLPGLRIRKELTPWMAKGCPPYPATWPGLTSFLPASLPSSFHQIQLRFEVT